MGQGLNGVTTPLWFWQVGKLEEDCWFFYDASWPRRLKRRR